MSRNKSTGKMGVGGKWWEESVHEQKNCEKGAGMEFNLYIYGMAIVWCVWWSLDICFQILMYRVNRDH